jgi:DNA-binding MarR family transcriptional regulator
VRDLVRDLILYADLPASFVGQRPAAKSVLVALVLHGNPDGTNAYPTVKTLGECINASQPTVKRLLVRLEAATLIERTGAPGRYRGVVWKVRLDNLVWDRNR